MTKKLSREQLKRDEVLETFGKGIHFVSSHRKGSVEAVAAAAGLAILVGAFVAFRSYRESEAAQHLSRALTILSSPVAGEPSPVDAAGTPYSSSALRDADAEKELKAAADLTATRSGREASVVLAARSAPGKADLASLDRFSRANHSILAATAEIDVIRTLESEGKIRDAIERAKRGIEASSTSAPKDALLMELARLYEKSGSPADAKATYQRLVSDYPNSLYLSDAQAKAGSL
ncbi:MAG: tetratricopeptide repeat protein [Thermoanaerobaculia bacterium]